MCYFEDIVVTLVIPKFQVADQVFLRQIVASTWLRRRRRKKACRGACSSRPLLIPRLMGLGSIIRFILVRIEKHDAPFCGWDNTQGQKYTALTHSRLG